MAIERVWRFRHKVEPPAIIGIALALTAAALFTTRL
jgi:hypothetical protein